MTTGHRSGHRGGGRGQMMVVFGLTLTVFIGAMMLGIDLSRLRAEAENAQRAANAAALAGVIFLPDFPANAYYRANEEAHKNGFYDGQNGVSVNATTVPGFNNRLKVTITEPVSLVFGGALGLGPKTVSRSAVAEFYQPLQTGSPDNVLGYAPYPTTMVSPAAPEGFYLENKGPYTLKESGDAYSPLFESFNGSWKFDLSPSDVPNNSLNPCTDDGSTTSPPDTQGTCKFVSGSSATSTTHNADHFSTNPPFSGYNYVINDPLTNTLMIKLFDPYDEVDYNTAAKNYDSARGTAWAPGDSTSANVSPASDRTSCAMSVGASCTKMIDQTGGNNAFGSHQVTLEFSLSGPSISPYDPGPAITNYASFGTAIPMGNCLSGSQSCVYSPSSNGKFDAGDDPTVCTGTSVGSCSKSPYAFRFLNYAVIHGPGYFRLNVQSVANGDGTEGTRGNAYGIAVCGIDTSSMSSSGQLAASSYTTNLSPNGLGATSDPYTNSPDTAAGDSVGWNASSCINPNNPSNTNSTPGACPHPNNPTPADQAAGLDKCIHVYGLGRMAIHNWLGSSSSTSGQTALVPLGMIPPEYAGKTLQVKLFDVGDIQGSGDYVNVLTPAGDLTHLPGTTNGTDQYPAGLPYSYTAAPDVTTQSIQTSGPYKTISSPVSVSDPSTPIIVTDSSGHVFNGSWLNIKIPLNVSTPTGKTYKDMVSQYGGYWKMQYYIAAGAAADDATTWEISVVGSPVHLVTE